MQAVPGIKNHNVRRGVTSIRALRMLFPSHALCEKILFKTKFGRPSLNMSRWATVAWLNNTASDVKEMWAGNGHRMYRANASIAFGTPRHEAADPSHTIPGPMKSSIKNVPGDRLEPKSFGTDSSVLDYKVLCVHTYMYIYIYIYMYYTMHLMIHYIIHCIIHHMILSYLMLYYML